MYARLATSRQLPPEIWFLVLQNAGTQWQRVALSVCRCLHDIALRFLFSAVKLYVIDEETAPHLYMNIHATPDQRDTLEALVARSYELLERCCTDSGFARIIKDLTMVEYVTTRSLGIFERRTLTRAMKAMHSLRKLTLLPHFFQHLPLCEYIPPSVEYLIMPYKDPAPALINAASHLKGFACFRTLPLADQTATIVAEYVGEPWRTELEPQLDALESASKLCHVAVTAGDLVDASIRLLGRLTSIELCYESHPNYYALPDMTFILRHAVALQDLNLSANIPTDAIDAFQNYAADKSVTPALRSFAIQNLAENPRSEMFREEHIARIAGFVSGRTLLTRLFLGLERIDSATKRSWVPNILSNLLKELPALRALGVGGLLLREEDWPCLADALPLELEALAIRWDVAAEYWNPDIIFEITHFSPVLDKLERMPGLSFLHLYCTYHPIRFDAEQLVQNLPALRTLALRRTVWDIDHVDAFEDYPTAENNAMFAETALSPMLTMTSRAGQPYAVLRKWNPWKVLALGDADFHSADHAWLLRMSILAKYVFAD
ncbi:hypothetical protein HDZ31DRAFT_33721 [Schizophyllum fasciatum]